MYAIITTQYFLRRSRKFLKKHPELRARYSQVIEDLRIDPFAPHLNYHHLGGQYEGIQAVSLTYDYRITLTVLITEREITLLDIGSHDEVYR
ncbi:MAG: type II toxin-antitoxin system mRNA interferase toxin, RelE/StbE family [Caldilineales bacterium]